MELIDFTHVGGYRLKQATLKKMQSSLFEFMNAIIKYFGVPEVGNFIIYGCEVVGPNITSGMMYIDGEFCPFQQTAGTDESKIAKLVTIQNLAFKNGTNPPVFRTTTAAINPAGVLLTDFQRLPEIKDLTWGNLAGIPAGLVFDDGYVHTDNNFTTVLLNKLNGIAANAEVNVQADWTQANPAADDFIKHKPVGNLLTFLKIGVFTFPDPGGSDILTVPIGDVGTGNYIVLGNMVAIGSGPGAGDDSLTWTTKDHEATNFTLLINEYQSESQDCKFFYVLIPIPV